ALVLPLLVMLLSCDNSQRVKEQEQREKVELALAILLDQYDKAVPLLKTRAEKGEASSQATLGQFYLKGLGVEQDFFKAAEWLEKASAQGESEASFALGVMHEAGMGVTKDQMRGTRLLEKAAEQGDKKAPQLLAVKYAQGIGVPKDNVTAHFWANIGAAYG